MHRKEWKAAQRSSPVAFKTGKRLFQLWDWEFEDTSGEAAFPTANFSPRDQLLSAPCHMSFFFVRGLPFCPGHGWLSRGIYSDQMVVPLPFQ